MVLMCPRFLVWPRRRRIGKTPPQRLHFMWLIGMPYAAFCGYQVVQVFAKGCFGRKLAKRRRVNPRFSMALQHKGLHPGSLRDGRPLPE